MPNNIQKSLNLIEELSRTLLIKELFILPTEVESIVELNYNNANFIPLLNPKKYPVNEWRSYYSVAEQEIYTLVKYLNVIKELIRNINVEIDLLEKQKKDKLLPLSNEIAKRKKDSVIKKFISLYEYQDLLDSHELAHFYQCRLPYSISNHSRFIQLPNLIKLKKVPTQQLLSGKTSINHFISLIDIEAKKLSSNLTKRDKLIQIMTHNSSNQCLYLNLAITHHHQQEFDQYRMAECHKKLKVWLRKTAPEIQWISLIRFDQIKGYNIHLFINDNLLKEWIYKKWGELTYSKGSCADRTRLIYLNESGQHSDMSRSRIKSIANLLYIISPLFDQPKKQDCAL